MADVRVQGLEYDEPGHAGSPTPIVVKVNNRELLGPSGFGPVACAGGLTNDGHAVEVTLRIKDAQTGDPVFTETKDGCARAEDWDNTLRMEFTPTLDAGEYVLQASLQVKGDNGSDTGQSHRLTVTGDSADLPDSEDSDGGFDFGDIDLDLGPGSGSGSGSGSGGGTVIDGLIGGGLPNANLALGVVGLLALAWLASSGASVAEVAK